MKNMLAEQYDLRESRVLYDTATGVEYRILDISDSCASMCDMSLLNEIQVKAYKLTDILQGICLERFKVQKNEYVVDYNLLSEEAKEAHKNNIFFVNDLSAYFGPDYLEIKARKRSSDIKELMNKHNLKPVTFWKKVKLYLQSGKNVYSLLDKRMFRFKREPYNYNEKPGRTPKNLVQGIVPSKEHNDNMAYGLEFYKKNQRASMTNSYYYMLGEKYKSGKDDGLLKPITQYPTFDQFKYYISKNISKRELEECKIGKQQFRNNCRILWNNSLKGVIGPSYMVEMDECELNVSLVSRKDRTQSIGRGVFYGMLDVYSRAIVGMYVGVENNSNLGFSSCFINLAEDKKKFCQKYGVKMKKNDHWPSNFYPYNMRFDNGSEYASKETERILNELNINCQYAPKGTGSLKGLIEQSFHQIDCDTAFAFEGKGLITRKYDSKHHKQAVMTLDELTSIMIQYVLIHNKKIMRDYPKTEDMIAKKIPKKPYAIWNYGKNKIGIRPIVINDQLKYALMTDIDNARLTRSGIVLEKLRYFNDSDKYLLQDLNGLIGNKRKPFACRMDERNVGILYYLRDGDLMEAPLMNITGNDHWMNFTRKEYQKYQECEKREFDLDKPEHQEMMSAFTKNLVATVKAAAKQRKGLANDKNLLEYRAIEKEDDKKHHRIVDVLGDDDKLPIDDIIALSESTSKTKDIFDEDYVMDIDDFDEF